MYIQKEYNNNKKHSFVCHDLFDEVLEKKPASSVAFDFKNNLVRSLPLLIFTFVIFWSILPISTSSG